MELNLELKASEEVVFREIDGETVLLDLVSGLYFGLDPVGGRVWQALSDGPQSLTDLCDIIASEFDAPRQQIVSDLATLANQLLEKNLVLQA